MGKRFILSLAVCCAMMTLPTSAIEYKHIEKDQTYDLDLQFQFTNPLVKVLDKRAGRVLVQILEGDRKGEVDWYSPSKLLTRSESRKQETENIGGGLAVGAAILCQFSETCRNNVERNRRKKNKPYASKPTKKALQSNSLVHAPEGPDRRVRIQNDCHKKVMIWLAYSLNGALHGGNYSWTIQPSKASKLNLRGKVALLADASEMYFYAKSTDSVYKWTGKHRINLEGKNQLPMQFINARLSNGNYNIRLTCA